MLMYMNIILFIKLKGIETTADNLKGVGNKYVLFNDSSK